MTDKQTPPDWVLIEAAKRSGWGDVSIPILQGDYEEHDPGTFRALCDMIERYEQPPVDRKLLCAREAYREWKEAGYPVGNHIDSPIAIRAIELFEEGFGK